MKFESSLVFLLLVAVSIEPTSGSPITVISFECTDGEKLCKNMTCNMAMSRNRVPTFNIGCLLPHPLHNITLELQLQQKHGKKYNTLIRTKENMCSAANNNIVRSQVIARVLQGMKRYIAGFECPFEGNVTATKMPLNLNFVPGFLPASVYKILIDVRNVDELLILIEMSFQIGKSKFN